MTKKKSTYKKTPKKDKLPTRRTPEVIQEHRDIIGQFYSNGFSGPLAVQEYRPHLSNSSSATVWNAIKNSPHNKAYIEEHQTRLSAMTDIKSEHIQRELIQWAFSDITRFIELTPQEIKELPAEIRRTIQSYEMTEHVDKHGNPAGTTIKVKLKPSMGAMQEVAKLRGMYSIDNDQKATKVNILNVLKNSSPDTLNTLLATIEQNSIENN
jgi:hypothetical protein